MMQCTDISALRSGETNYEKALESSRRLCREVTLVPPRQTSSIGVSVSLIGEGKEAEKQ